MRDEELDLYFDYFRSFNEQLEQPDHIILLHTPDVTELLRRISERGRTEEATIGADFLRGLNGYYDTFAAVAERKYDVEVLTVDVTERDIRRGDGRAFFLDQCESFFRESRADGELPFVDP
jgi:deoxyadenosine/deoxycytidine kinase